MFSNTRTKLKLKYNARLVFNRKVRVFGSIIMILSCFPCFLHLVFDHDSTEEYFGWYNQYTFFVLFGLWMTAAMIIVGFALQAYYTSVIPVAFVSILAFIELYTKYLEHNIYANISYSIILTLLVVLVWRRISRSEMYLDDASEKLNEQIEVTNNILNEIAELEKEQSLLINSQD